ncbi:alcohol dehydrogenase [Purpureocillium lilacinum]|uniref:Alcohol dehydrogenase n=1 Tax=Purpureocillium lilacinum TaxID=33203 RepID=A0A179HSJ1_PURLI|nr:alcohol dehydrogenase [Purpureocillium lilacinum]OAQ92832.1 alcohol dehydrogenase [Purpureocillium lilacinum]
MSSTVPDSVSASSFPIGSHGRAIPSIGFGTFQPDVNPTHDVADAVLRALHAGYRHIDTAWMYGDGDAERGVGEALRRWGGPREDVFIVTKLANAHHKPEDVLPALELSLKNLGVEYGPVAYERIGTGPDEWKTVRHPDRRPKMNMEATRRYTATWAAMEDLIPTGKVKEIGVSNFSIKKLEKLLRGARIPPVVNQVELHPYLPQDDLLAYCASHNIHVTAFSPLGGKPVAAVAANADVPGPLHSAAVTSVAQKRGITPAQVLLKWGIQRGTSVIPKAYTPLHILDNIAAAILPDLPREDVEAIDRAHVATGSVRYINPVKHWGFDIYNPSTPDPSEEP